MLLFGSQLADDLNEFLQGGRMKILIVEDDDVRLSFLPKKLEACGYEVVLSNVVGIYKRYTEKINEKLDERFSA
jgi:hypothetical protein